MCTGLGKAVSSVPPLLRVLPVIHFAGVQLGLSLESKLVSFEITSGTAMSIVHSRLCS